MAVSGIFGAAFLLVSVSWCQQADLATRQAEALFKKADKDGDGKLSREEFPKPVIRLFDSVDKDNDGLVSFQEDVQYRRNRINRKRPSELPKDAVVHRDLVYTTIGQRDLMLDLYLPAKEASRPLPVVMWIHGGGWRSGSKNNAGPARAMIEKGFAVVDVDYRLSGEAIFPAQIQDCKAAVRWVRANAKKYELNPDRIGAWGSSAGGHLVAMLGVSGDVNEFETDVHSDYSSRVQAVCDWFGPTDLLKMNTQAVPGATMNHDAPDSPESLLIGGPIQQEPFRTKATKANPIIYVTADDSPILIVHGDNDLLVSHRQSEEFHQALTKAGVKSSLHIEPGAGHGLNGGKASRGDLTKKSIEFLQSHLQK